MAIQASPIEGQVSPGRIESWSSEGSALIADYGGPIVAVTALTPGMLHVRVGRGGALAPRRSWAITEPDSAFPPVEVDVIDKGNSVMLVTSALAVELAPGARISISDAAGDPLLVDPESGGPEWRADGTTVWTKAMPERERYYGFGERHGLLEKRGRHYSCWTTDEWRHQGPTTDELYIAVPFFMGLGIEGRAYGVLLDNTFRTSFDLSDIAGGRMRWQSEGGELDWYFFAGPEPATVVKRLSEVVGRMPLPPLWALGYHQSRLGYASAAEVLAVARELRARDIPADAIHLDLDHMDERRSFTWDPERFPDPQGLVFELGRLDFETVVVVSACVKREAGYDVYDSGHREGVFLRDRDGEELTGYVWPGLCVFPDHARADTRAWWGEQYRVHLDVGVRGFVNDMNEPAMRDLPVEDERGGNVEPALDVQHGTAAERAMHAEVRNVYGHLENRGTYEYLRNARPDERPFLLSRAGCAGMQRYAGTWTGDMSSVWEHLETSLPQLLGLGLSGVPLAGADIGGFYESCGPELLVRWTQLGALTPFARNHSSRDTAPQEPWAWGEEVEAACRAAIELRYRLLPYLYTLVEEASRTGVPILRPLFFHYADDERTREISDQALLGSDLLLAPVVRPGVRSRAVYLPRGLWTDLRSGTRYAGGDVILASAELSEGTPLFARGGSILPLGPCVRNTRERSADGFQLRIFSDEGRATGCLYEDDGSTLAHTRGESCTTELAYADGVLSSRRRGSFAPALRTITVVVDGRELPERVHDAGDWEIRLG